MFRSSPQIILLIFAVQCFGADGKPFLQGISFKKDFEINFKPFERKPITFIKEKWSPFGVFGRKRVIVKRQAEILIPISKPDTLEQKPAPVFEHLEEIQNTAPLMFLPPPPPNPVSVVPVSEVPVVVITPSSIPKDSPTPLPVVTTVRPLFISSTPRPLSTVAPPPVPLIITPSPPPIKEPELADERAISSNFIVPPPSEGPPPPGLYTDISRSEPVREYVDVAPPIPPTPPVVDNSIKPEIPRSDIVINDNVLVRGSKLALYFGSIFLSLMSQFMSNARATFDQMTNPVPVYNN
ncbi:unnamed protein product [Chrysodeixis includens]|uniref:Uncharacterized protein n=1 Tax=Chrysodeixis includens TaxID=689277 RepID=A0A9N8KWT8_CHRIL|nr:unnamed protein product [Chrysodeixis includens]